MDSDLIQEAWQNPLKRLEKLAASRKVSIPDNPMPLILVRAFATKIGPCANNEDALRAISEQPEGAGKFLFLAFWLEGQRADAGLKFDCAPSPNSSPWLSLALVILDYLDRYETLHPEKS